MFIHFKILLYSLTFFLLMELVLLKENLFLAMAVLALSFSVIVSVRISKRWLFAILPFIFSFFSMVLLYLVDSFSQKQIFIIISSFIYYVTFLGIYRLKNYSRDQTARGLIAASAAATAFFSFAASYGIYLNISIQMLWILVLVFLVVSFLISYQYLSIIEEKEKRKVLVYSLILGLAMAEIAWVINFWPFGYLTTGVIALIFYYVLWDLTQSHFLNLLSKKRVVANMVLFSILIGLVLASSKWLPMV